MERGGNEHEQLEFAFGAQRLLFEPPWLARLDFRDPVNAAEVESSLGVLRTWIARYDRVFVLLDMSGMTEIPTDVRRMGVSIMVKYDALAIFGASFPVRVGATMLIKATQAIRKDLDFPVRFFLTQREALSWLRRLAGRASSPG